MRTGQQRDDVIVQAAIVKCKIDLYNGALICSEQKLLTEYCQVSSRLDEGL